VPTYSAFFARMAGNQDDGVVNNAGIFSAKPFTEYTIDEFRRFVSTNLEGFIFITQLAVKQITACGCPHRHPRHRGSASSAKMVVMCRRIWLFVSKRKQTGKAGRPSLIPRNVIFGKR